MIELAETVVAASSCAPPYQWRAVETGALRRKRSRSIPSRSDAIWFQLAKFRLTTFPSSLMNGLRSLASATADRNRTHRLLLFALR